MAAKFSSSTWKRMISILGERKVPYLISLIGVGLSDASVSIITSLLVKRVMDAVKDRSMQELVQASILFSAVMAVVIVIVPVMQYVFGRAVSANMMQIRLNLFRKIGNLPVSYFENKHSGDTMSRMTNDFDRMEMAYAGNIRSVIALCAAGVGSAVVMLTLDWRFAAAMIGMGIVSAYLNARFAKPLRRISAAIQSQASILMERISDQVAGAQVIRMFQMQERMNRQVQGVNRVLAGLMMKRSRTHAYMNSTNYWLRWMNSGGAFILGALMVISGQIEFAVLLSIILLLENISNLFSQFGTFWSNLQASLAGADRIFELLGAEEEPERHRVVAVANESSDDRPAQGIELCNVSFSYEEGSKLLNGLNLSVEKGSVIALAGPSGGGKSTVLKLLLGFYSLDEGDILLDGKRYSDYTMQELRNRIAYVSQDAYLFAGTIEENIRYGRPDAPMEDIMSAAQAANAHEFIMEQNDGYQTLVGERGAKLSGGQKQRIAIARALLKSAPVLLLDEATSALDSESELAVQQGLQRLMEGKTTIAIAHRLSTIQQADKICVIERGMIVEQGKHAELMAARGIYRRLHDMQERAAESPQQNAG